MSKCARFLYGPPYIKPMTPRRVMEKNIQDLSVIIKRAEGKQMPLFERMAIKLNLKKPYIIVNDVPRKAAHLATKPATMVEVLDELRIEEKLPANIMSADLGSGIGAAAFAEHHYFDCLVKMGFISNFHITGFEMSDKFRTAAEKIARAMEMKNISFDKRDFTELTKEDLKSFNLIYIWWPFLENFGPIMNKVFPRINSNTVIVARQCRESNILEDKTLFTPVYHRLYLNYGKQFALYIRTAKELTADK